MKSKDQLLLEKAYTKIYENTPPTTETDWLHIPKSEHNKPCICGSGHPFNDCCGIGAKEGDIVYVMDENECHWLDFSNIKEPYKTYWNESKNKCGILIGRKIIPSSLFTSSSYAQNDPEATETIYGVKRSNGKIYQVSHSLIDSDPSEKALKHYKSELNINTIEDTLPELKGMF